MITLKKVGIEHCELIYGWRNHPKTRRYFLDPKEIPFDEHEKWFAHSLTRDDRIILLAYEAHAPVGIIRFDILKTPPLTAEIDIYVDPERHRQGFGRKMLAEGENWIRKNACIDRLIARVKEGNLASIKAFQSNGFVTSFVLFEKKLSHNSSRITPE